MSDTPVGAAGEGAKHGAGSSPAPVSDAPGEGSSSTPASHAEVPGGENLDGVVEGHVVHGGHEKNLMALCVAALGVVYGDIGTSPLYSLKECFAGHAHLAVTEPNVIGVLSLIIWSLIGLISVLYLGIVLNADNDGEGGILALLALVVRGRRAKSLEVSWALIVLGLFGAALLYGDGVITPAISVLSAIEGLEIATKFFTPYVIPITLVILIGLFMVQSKGTEKIGKVFGPITIVWFSCLALLGLAEAVKQPRVLAAFNPTHAVSFLFHNGWHGFVAMGSVFLAVTGGEALYADMGHFGKKPIRIVWFAFVLPALLLNYLGQGALLINNPAAVDNPFFRLVPSWATIPMVILAAAATVIASQAVISGVFSLTRQAIQLGYLPRLDVRHTSAEEMGQIYLPQVNWVMLVATLVLVVWFRTSSALAAAYGIAVTMTMVITVVLTFFVMRDLWNWSLPVAAGACFFFLCVDLVFVGANMLKVFEGGWFPLMLGVVLYVLMITWKKGRELLHSRLMERHIPVDRFFHDIDLLKPHRVRGTAIYLTSEKNVIPNALQMNLDHNKILHDVVVLVTFETVPHPYAMSKTRTRVESLPHGFHRVVQQVGFMEQPDLPSVVFEMRIRKLPIDERDMAYFVGRESLVVTDRPGLPIWQETLFAVMARNSETAAAYFGIPAHKVVELGTEIEL